MIPTRSTPEPLLSILRRHKLDAFIGLCVGIILGCGLKYAACALYIIWLMAGGQ